MNKKFFHLTCRYTDLAMRVERSGKVAERRSFANFSHTCLFNHLKINKPNCIQLFGLYCDFDLYLWSVHSENFLLDSCRCMLCSCSNCIIARYSHLAVFVVAVVILTRHKIKISEQTQKLANAGWPSGFVCARAVTLPKLHLSA